MIISSFGFVLLLHLHHSIADDDQTITITRQRNRNKNNHKADESAHKWKFRTFPGKTNNLEYNPRSIFADRNDFIEFDSKCDDGIRNLAYDWDKSITENYTCAGETIKHDGTIAPTVHSAWIPPMYTAPHYCMDVNISYADPLVTFGGHRKLWARYGEYTFIPKQRWLHNAENGAVIMLYHPCADPHQVDNLRKIVTSCLYRHIITPYNLLPIERPLALVTWGWQLSMNTVPPKSSLVQRFIRERAMKAPRNLNLDGKYDYALKQPAKMVSDENDGRLCITIM